MAKKRLGEILVEAGAITEQELLAALERQVKGERLGQTLLAMGAIDQERLAWALGDILAAPVLNLGNVFIDPKILGRFSRVRCQHHKFIPVSILEDRLTVAMADPFDVVALDEARSVGGMPIRVAVATEASILKAIEKSFTDELALDEVVSRVLPTSGIEMADADEFMRLDDNPIASEMEQFKKDADSKPVMRLVNSIIRDAIRMKASDVHLEPMETCCLVRYRIDGMMRTIVSLPLFLHPRTVCRIKVLAQMDIAERRIPLDGRCKVRFQGNDIDLRVSTLPTQHGEKVVIRVLNSSNAHIRLENMGLPPDSLRKVERMVRFTQGIVLLTGPTGSGKTSTLYAMLHRLKGENLNIVTLENPIEYDIPGIIQTQINDKAGMTFAAGFRSILRQDPDAIMVGEIRDSETADIAFNAAMTGHLVLSTLHTNDSCSAPVRLRELGVSPFLVTAALKGVIAQRLVRRLCTQCREGYMPDAEVCKRLGLNPREPVMLYRAKGCSACNGRGYSGRVGIYEILTLTDKLKDMILQGANTASQLGEMAAREGMRDLMEEAAALVIQGATTLEEVMRVVPVEERKTFCPQCEHRVERFFQSCPYCSFQLARNICRVCARELAEGWNFCPYCAHDPAAPGISRDRSEALEALLNPQTFAPAAPPEPPPPASLRCASCGMTMKPSWDACPLCLTARSAAAPATAVAETPVPPPVASVSPEPLPASIDVLTSSFPVGPAPSLAEASAERRPLLLVADDPGTIMEVRKALADLQLTLIHVSSGEESLRRLDKVSPAVILVETLLPGMDGATLCRKLQSHPLGATVPTALIISPEDAAPDATAKVLPRPIRSAAIAALLKPVSPLVAS